MDKNNWAGELKVEGGGWVQQGRVMRGGGGRMGTTVIEQQ